MDDETGTPFGALVRDYLRHQDPDRLSRLRAAVRRARTFDPDLDLAGELGDAMRRGEHVRVAETIAERMPGAALSPAAHVMLGAALRAMGDEASARREERMARLSVVSVLATGDGSRERPWSVLRVADEYDVMRARGLHPRGVSTTTTPGATLDKHDTDGGEVWFAVEHPARTTAGLS